MTQNIFYAAKDRWIGLGLEFKEEYFTNGGVAYEFNGKDEVIRAMNDVMLQISEHDLEGEYHITYSQRYDDDSDEYIYRIIIEEL